MNSIIKKVIVLLIFLKNVNVEKSDYYFVA